MILRLLLVAIVALTSQQLALARGQAVAAGEMVLCVGGGFVTVSVDADGNPVGPPYICPDGVQAMAFAPDAPVRHEGPATIARPADLVMAVPAANPRLYLPVPQARAPPRPV